MKETKTKSTKAAKPVAKKVAVKKTAVKAPKVAVKKDNIFTMHEFVIGEFIEHTPTNQVGVVCPKYEGDFSKVPFGYYESIPVLLKSGERIITNSKDIELCTQEWYNTGSFWRFIRRLFNCNPYK